MVEDFKGELVRKVENALVRANGKLVDFDGEVVAMGKILAGTASKENKTARYGDTLLYLVHECNQCLLRVCNRCRQKRL